jgi:DNA gyrase subunit A
LAALIRELRGILGSAERQIEVMLEELNEVLSTYGDERRTVILRDAEEEVVEVHEEEADEDVVVTVSHEGFVKRMPMHLYRRRVSSGKALAGMERYEDDYIERMFVARSQGWILAFTRSGQLYYLPVLELPESGRSSRGQSVYALIAGADRSDPIVAMLPAEDLEAEVNLLFVSRRGVMKRTALSEFRNARAGGMIATGVKEGDEVLDVALSDGEAEVILLSEVGRAIRFPESEISVLGRTAQGIKGIDLRGQDRVVGMLLIRRDASVLTVTEDGMAKRTPVGEFPLQKRGGLGTWARPSGAESPIVTALEVQQGDEVMLVSAAGQVARLAVEEVPVQGRRTQGKRVVRLPAGDRVVEVTRSASSSRGSGLGASGSGPATRGGQDEGAGSEGNGSRPADYGGNADAEGQFTLLDP